MVNDNNSHNNNYNNMRNSDLIIIFFNVCAHKNLC